MAKEPVCMCGDSLANHGYWSDGKQSPGCVIDNCFCQSFTDKRISARRAASKAGREAGPKADIIKLLDARKVRFFRMNSGNIHIRKGNHLNLNKPGTPDIQCLIKFKVSYDFCPEGPHQQIIWIEVKKSDGKPSKEQVAFKEQAEALGETYLLARSASEVETWLNKNL